jgi:hypothetical protein
MGLPDLGRRAALWCSAVQLSIRWHVHPRGVVLRMDGRNRTCNRRFWGPALSLVELRP